MKGDGTGLINIKDIKPVITKDKLYVIYHFSVWPTDNIAINENRKTTD